MRVIQHLYLCKYATSACMITRTLLTFLAAPYYYYDYYGCSAFPSGTGYTAGGSQYQYPPAFGSLCLSSVLRDTGNTLTELWKTSMGTITHSRSGAESLSFICTLNLSVSTWVVCNELSGTTGPVLV